MTLDEFLKLKIPAVPKLISLFVATRPQKVFTHQEVSEALSIHPADVETGALFLLRSAETPFHPILVGIPASFEMPADHDLRAALAEALGTVESATAQAKAKAKAKNKEAGNG